MCGISGFYNTKKTTDVREMHAIGKKMNDTLHHRGPDSGDVWQDPDHPLVLAFRRLAILDLTPEGSQPMASASGRYMIIFNGEIYGHQSLQKELENKGHAFRGRSDTEVMLGAIEQWGLNHALQKLNGMFAIVLWDRKEKRLHFIRDRLGKKPLYIGWAGKSLVFGSELKALRAHPDFKAKINKNTLTSYMRYCHVPAPHSIYEGIWSLPAGMRISLSIDAIKPNTDLKSFMEPYWSHVRVLEEQREKITNKSDAEIIDEFEALLSTCVDERMVSDVPLGAFLSGGIDSSTIVALMQKQSARPIKTYSIGFKEAGYDEAAYAKKIAAHLGTDHHEHYISAQDGRDVIPSLARMYDEPFADISQIPTYLVSKFARRDVTVALSGDGGDEMLGGYNRHITAPQLLRRMRLIPRPMRKIMARMIMARSTQNWDASRPDHPQFGVRMHKIASIIALKSQDDIYQRLISHWDNPSALVLGGQEDICPLTDPEFQPTHKGRGGLNFAEAMMHWDTLSYLPNGILTKVDRASMATSLEVRAPLLDRRIYEYAWTLPMQHKIRNGQGKWLLRQVLKRHIPSELFERHKQGFSVPIGEWLSGSLKDWAEDLLDAQKLEEDGLLNAQMIRDTWDAHLAGNGDQGHKLWNVLMFQAWKREWM